MSERLTEAESEFVDEMRHDGNATDAWCCFDPDYRQTPIARLFRRGWFERRGSRGSYEYRWTPAGREALAKASA